MSISPGDRLGLFEIVSQIGQGGMGVVYRAHDTKLNRPVAVKLLAEELGDAAARRRFQREAQTASSLNHPHIITVFDAGEWEGRQYLVMEFVDGCTLSEWAQRENRNWRAILDLVLGVADGLAVAHDAGIVHRDIKPSNILVANNGYAKLADFGLAKLTEKSQEEETRTLTAGETRPGMVVGTIAYMSPEQASGKPLDARSDIFSFAVVLYELLAGRRPFEGATDLELLQTVIHGASQPLPSGLPIGLRMAVDKALEKDPRERYQSMREFVLDLRRLLRHTGEAATARRKGPFRLWVASGALAVVAGLAAIWQINLRRADTHPIRSIAVLPLQNLSGDPSQEYFSDGTTEALISGLAQIHALKVISRTSVMRYKGTTRPLPAIGQELGVDAILIGSVQKAGSRVRISAQLIRASSDSHLWAQEYDREISDVLKLEGEVARAIAQEIRIQVTPEERTRLTAAHSIDPAAQEAFLLGRYHGWKFNEKDLSEAIGHFNRAIQLQPDFAASYALLSRTWIERGVWGGMGFREVEAPARTAALKALELDPNLAEAHTCRAHILSDYDWDWSGAEKEYQRAVDLDPNSLDAHNFYSVLLMTLGRFPQAIQEAERAVALDPVSSAIHSTLGRVLYRARRYDAAVPQFKRAIELDSQNFGAYTRLAEVYLQTGKAQEAVDLIEQSLRIRGADLSKSSVLGVAYALAGRREDALAILRRVTAGNPSRGEHEDALLYFALGDKNRGFEWLTRAYDRRQLVIFDKFDPRFDSVRSDPRFQELVRRLRIPD
jgi:serine/threonine protein kinase/Tfp pilus assembly protein PilF